MKKNTPTFDPTSLPELGALINNHASLMGAAKLATALSRDPAAMVATATALLDGPARSNTSLAAFGLDPNALGRAVCEGVRAQNIETSQVASLVRALIFSNIAVDEQQVIEQHLNLLREERKRDFEHPLLADFTSDDEPVADMLKRPGAPVWLGSPLADFSDALAWAAMEGRPDLAEAAIANPAGLLHGSAKHKINPGDSMSLSKAEPSLLVEYARRVKGIDSAEQALYLAQRWLGYPDIQGAPGARLRFALLGFIQKEMKNYPDARGEVIAGLAQAAHASEDQAFAHGIVRMADEISLGDDPARGIFIFHPSGSGGIDLPKLSPPRFDPSVILPTFTWADYILAYGGALGPGDESEKSRSRQNSREAVEGSGSTYSAALDFLAESMRALGLDQPILARGTPQALRDLAQLEHDVPSREPKNHDAILALIESVHMRLSMPTALVTNGFKPRL
jgi:hypothetical protein